MRILLLLLIPLLALGREMAIQDFPVSDPAKRDRENEKAMEQDSLFRIYSMTKGLTSAAALMLCEEGKMSLDDPLEVHLPGFAEPKVWVEGGELIAARRSPTVRDLLRHTGGIANRRDKNPVSELYREGWRLGQDGSLTELMTNIEKALPFEEFLEKRLMKPLGMVDTGYAVSQEKEERLAGLYFLRDGSLRATGPLARRKALQEPKLKGGGSGLISTTTDYARFLQMIANGGEFQGKRYLRKETVDLMRTNQLPIQIEAIAFGEKVRHGTGFGLGFSVHLEHKDPWDKSAVVGEYGWGGAASTHYWISPKHELVVVTMEQTMPYNSNLEGALKSLIYKSVIK